MAFDGITTNAVEKELTYLLQGSRIDKIYQPQKYEILLHLRNQKENFRLLLSAHPVYARICTTSQVFSNPKNPPLFCMVLRKHLEGGKIISFEQPSLERILKINIESRTELGELTKKSLIVEIMGKHSNIILINPEENTVIDGIKRVSSSTSQYRQIVPGAKYILPPVQDKLNLLKINQEDFTDKLMDNNLSITTEKALLNTLLGFSPSLCSQIAKKLGLYNKRLEFFGEYELNLLWQFLEKFRDDINNNNYQPTIYLDKNDHYQEFSPFRINAVDDDNIINFPSVIKTVDAYYNWQINHHNFISTKNNLQKTIAKELKRCEKKLALQLETVNKSKETEKDKILGELITANIYQIKKGMKEIEVLNYYDNNNPITIKLVPELTPSENAQRYYKKYNRAKGASKKASIQADQTKKEISYLESLNYWLSEINNYEDFYDLEQELIDSGYLKLKDKAKKPTKEKPAPRTYTTKEGFTIYVGKNNKQNDWLTFKIAKDNDLWFHAKDIPGSHVILKLNGLEATNDAIEKAALLAAYYSKGKYSANVAVDYTQAKNVKKIKGAKPGLVTYVNYKTIYITPDEESIKLFLG